ncbi:GtrA family protein [Sphingomonas rhizophila]|uniref:GtrA family protein n=1 Tax=Sphingomonas rhizophila TaxID=2071607 RepID=A0A7G9SAB5_9SPHN|nr:GtrA family protein [Sphingomonas rhizophila]QNN64790.1 GtrA family protein [Sphingomonas rhizophila]
MVQSTLQRLDPEHRATVAQLLRYGIAGGVITLAVAASYWALAEFAGLDPMVSLAVVFLFFSGVSYVTHGAFSFRGHEADDPHHVRATRFLAVNILGFALNQFFVWLLVKHFNGPTWWPTIPMVLVTPFITFALHRRYVYS